MHKPIYTAVSCVGLLAVFCGLGAGGCTYVTKGHAEFDLGIKERGVASWYGEDFHGLATASGEIYDMHGITAAHRSLPLGTVVKVVNVNNGRQVVAEVNDRGPYKRGRIIDLSFGAAERLGMARNGVGLVEVEIVGPIGLLFPGNPSDSGPETPAAPSVPLHALLVRSGSVPAEAGRPRLRSRPAEVRRFPRLRRVADILEADHTVYRTTAGLVLS